MSFLDFMRKGITPSDIICCDESEYLIWRWLPKNQKSDVINQETRIPLGAAIRVKAGEIAILQFWKNGNLEKKYIVGPYEQVLTKNYLPDSIITKSDYGNSFSANVYFINQSQEYNMNFGVAYFDVFAPQLLNIPISVAARGTLHFMIDDFTNFILIHELNNFRVDDLKAKIKNAVNQIVRKTIQNAVNQQKFSIFELESNTVELGEDIEFALYHLLREKYGIQIKNVNLIAVTIDKDCDGYRRLMQSMRI